MEILLAPLIVIALLATPTHLWLMACDSTILWAFFAVTTVWATVSAYRLRFREYELRIVTGPVAALLGCCFFWSVCFLFFLINRQAVRKGLAWRRVAPRRWGRTLGFGVGYLLLSLFGAAIFIPNVFGSRPLPPPERFAALQLTQYAEAQRRYRRLATDPGQPPTYCDNFRNLHYRRDGSGERIGYVAKVFADAFAGPPSGTADAAGAAEKPSPYAGYLYLEDPVLAGATDGSWESGFALVAYPAGWNPADRILWIGVGGNILATSAGERAPDEPPALLEPRESPLYKNAGTDPEPGPARKWTEYGKPH